MSQCIVPNWNLRHQRQEQVEGEEGNRSSHVQSDQNLSYVVPMSNYEVTELTWENGQLGLHGLGGIPPPPPHAQAPQTKQTWNKPGDTLESIVHQATFSPHAAGKWGENSTSHMLMEQNQQGNNLSSMAAPSSNGKWRENNSSTNHMHLEQNPESLISMAATSSAGKWRDNGGMTVKVNSINPTSSGGKWRENSQKGVKLSSMASSSGGKSCGENTSASGNLVNKRVRSESKHFQVEESACASASATFCRDTDTTMMTWANSFESPRSLKDARNRDDDSAYQDFSENQDGERMTKEESFRSQSSARRSRAATVHNQSERRRRDRINEKMKALQKLVPNASKTDKASMLEEVIEYLKQLQSQVQMMSNARNVNMPQMVMPLGMQQQLHQMSILARMGMGMGMGMDMGMLDVARNVPHSFPQLIHGGGGAAPSFVSPPFAMPPVIPPHTNQLKPNINAATMTTSVPSFNDAYNTFIAQQSMNMDFLNKMSALYRQQGNQLPKKPVSSSMPANHGQGV